VRQKPASPRPQALELLSGTNRTLVR